MAAYQDSLAIREELAAQGRRQRRVAARPLGQLRADRRRAAERGGISKGAVEGLPGQPRNRRGSPRRDAGNAEWQRDLSVSFNKIGDVQRSTGGLKGALKGLPGPASRSGEKLAARVRTQRRLAARPLGQLPTRSATCSGRGGISKGALQAYRDSLAIAEKLAAQDAGNTDWQRDLSVSFDRIGDVQSARGDLEGT